MKFNIILAVDDKLGLGKNNNLAWKIKEDMIYFKNITSNTSDKSKKNAVIMGRKTWESIPDKFRPLPGRINCILSRKIIEIENNNNISYFTSLDKALKNLSKNNLVENIFIIGGANLYNQILDDDRLNKIYLTKVNGNHDCDVFFDGIPSNFELESKSEEKESNLIKFRFEVYKKNIRKNLNYFPINFFQKLISLIFFRDSKTSFLNSSYSSLEISTYTHL